MTNKNNMRTFTYLFEIKADGKEAVEIKRSVKDIEGALERANRATADNIKVTAKKIATDEEAKRQVRRSISESNKLSKSTDNLIQYYTRLNQELRKEDVNMEVVNAQMRAGVSSSSAHGKQIEQLVLEYQRLRNEGSKAGSSMRNFRGVMQNAGWQLQDTVVQLQMGTSAFTVLSQQGSQFASAFGPSGAILGAVIALGGAFGGVLFKSLIDAKDATEELEEAQTTLNSIITTGSGTVGDYADSLVKLAKVDAGLAKLKITQGVVEAEKAIKALAEGLDEIVGESRTRYAYELQQQLGITAEEAKALNEAQKEFSKTGDVTPLRNVMVSLNSTYGKTNEKLNENLGALTDTVVKAKEYEAAIEKLDSGLSNLNSVIEEGDKKNKKQKDTAAELIKEWTNLNFTYGLSEISLAKFNVTQELTEAGQQGQIGTVNALIDRYYALKRAREDDVIAAEDAAKREASLSKIEGGIDSNGDPYAAEIKRYKTNRDELAYLRAEYDASDTAAQARINDAKEAEERRHADAMKQIESTLLQAQLSNYGSYLSGMAGLMTQLTALTEQGSAEAEAMFYATQAIAFASTLVNTEMAAIQAMSDPSIPFFGAKIAASTVIRSLGYASAGIIAGTTIAGAFDDGGMIPQDQYGIVSEYGDELVNGVLVKGKQGGTRVTSREDTAKIMNQNNTTGGATIIQNITVTGNGDAVLTQAMKKAAKQGAREGYAMVANDFKTGRGIRQTLKRSARV